VDWHHNFYNYNLLYFVVLASTREKTKGYRGKNKRNSLKQIGRGIHQEKPKIECGIFRGKHWSKGPIKAEGVA
jgi:hypothetical protein